MSSSATTNLRPELHCSATRDTTHRLQIACLLCGTFLIVEAVGGVYAYSLAILSDAAHLFADLAAFGTALLAARLARLPPSAHYTFGLQRTESLAALLSMLSLALVSVWLTGSAVYRLCVGSERMTDGRIMSGIAFVGVLVNIVLAIVLGEDHVHLPGFGTTDGSCAHDHGHIHSHKEVKACSDHDHKDEENGHDHSHQQQQESAHAHSHSHSHSNHSNDKQHACESDALLSQHNDEVESPCHSEERNVNLHAAYLHVLGDLAQSAGVLIAGLILWVQPTWYWIDPVCTIFFSLLVLYSTIGTVKASLSVLLEQVPPRLDWCRVHETLCAVPGVDAVHDLHIWAMAQNVPSLSVHASVQPGADQDLVFKAMAKVCLETFGIQHATIQVQSQEGPCVTCGVEH